MTKWAESSGNFGQISSKNEGDRSEGRVGAAERQKPRFYLGERRIKNQSVISETVRRKKDSEIYIKSSFPLAEAAHETVLGGTYAPARAIALRCSARTAQARSARPLRRS